MGKYGDFNNVILSDEEYKKLSDKFGSSLEEKINDLSYYLETKPVKYKSHYAVILNWARRDAKKVSSHPAQRSGFNNFKNNEKSDYDEIRKKSLERLLEGGYNNG